MPGFKAEIEVGGNIYSYSYDAPLSSKEWVTVAKVTLKGGMFSIEHMIPQSNDSKTRWGLTTNQFIKVKSVMLSPNYWDDNAIGSKHFLFALEDAVNDEKVRPFFNEQLSSALHKDRKVFEVMAGKLTVPDSTNQVSGLGFSETTPNSLIVRVTGAFKRDLKIKI